MRTITQTSSPMQNAAIFKVVLPYLVNFGPFLTNYVHQIGEKTEKNSDKILLAYHLP